VSSLSPGGSTTVLLLSDHPRATPVARIINPSSMVLGHFHNSVDDRRVPDSEHREQQPDGHKHDCPENDSLACRHLLHCTADAHRDRILHYGEPGRL
jgi:hypothetical protein